MVIPTPSSEKLLRGLAQQLVVAFELAAAVVLTMVERSRLPREAATSRHMAADMA